MKSIGILAAALALMTATALAQAPKQSQAPDYSVEVAPGLHTLTWGNNYGNMGLNVGLSVGEDGLLLVDSQDEPEVPRLLSRMAQISNKPVRVVINSHWHSDHIGGNATFAKQGATIIAHENTLKRLMTAQPNPLGRATQRAFPSTYWPTVTFKDTQIIHFNGDDVEVIHFPNTHTDADVVMLFRRANVLFTTALFNNGAYNRVDLRGGSLEGQIAAYDKLLPTLDDRVRVVPGRGPVGTKADLAEYRQVMVTLRERISRIIRDGKTLAEAVALKPTADLDARWANGPIRPDQLVEEIYSDLKRTVR